MAAPRIHVVRDELPAPTGTSVDRYQHGWRSGKPVEDPEKLKRWGFIGAKPSEYLVCTHGGQIDRKRSGQGMRIFKWPWLAVAIVPTTLQRIEFVADQITRERVGVEITGVAVYRIAEPEIAFRVLNFTYGEAASEKLAATLREMFVGAARRLVANLSLEDCLTKRKETIATFLMEEIAPVVGGEGSLADHTATGWGVVIDTIEIQQVKIQSEQVFAHLQAPYRAEIAARAELAELERARQVTERRADTERLSQEAQLEATRATRALRARTEAEAAEVEAREAQRQAELVAASARRHSELERDRVLHAIAIAEEERRAKAASEAAAIEADITRIEAEHRAALRELDHSRAIASQRQTADLELRRTQAEVDRELRRLDAESRAHEQALDVEHQRRLAELEQLLAQSRALRELVGALPELAGAIAPRAETLHLTQIGEQRGALDALPSAVAQLLTVARSLGLELPKRD
jgi:flotillin